MFTKTLAAVGSAVALTVLGAGSVAAQGVTSGSDMAPKLSQSVAAGDELSVPTRDVTPSRLPSELRERQRFSEVAQAGRRGGARGPDYTALAQAAVTASGVACDVTEAVNPGVTPEQESIYEVACASGPGYIVVSARTPRSYSCLEVEGRAAATRVRYIEADVGQQCMLPANQNGVAIISEWARDAGVSCRIDEAIDIGKNDQGNVVYEVGCAGADGYWLERVGNRWTLLDCLELTSFGETCRFTTPREQAEGFAAKLAGTEAAGCDVAQVRLIGTNPNGRFYEARCAADGEGYIARVSNEGATQQVYPCATAQRIAGGCTLTRGPAPTL